MPASVIAAQLYSVRAFTKTPADIAVAMKKVKQAGYDAVQVSGMGPIDPKELAKILNGEGLNCCATHVSFDRLRDDTNAMIEEHRILNCKYPAIGGMPWTVARTKEGFLGFAKEMSGVARKVSAAGLTFGYHNHSWELEKFDGKTGLELMIAESDPAVTFEIDTYWIQHGGADPAAYIRKVKNRIPLVHFKDMVVAVDNTSPAPAQFPTEPAADYAKRIEEFRKKKPIMAEVGEGNLNWPEIIKACKEAGVVWYIVEQDTCQRDPFESLAISLRNLKAMGLS